MLRDDSPHPLAGLPINGKSKAEHRTCLSGCGVHSEHGNRDDGATLLQTREHVGGHGLQATSSDHDGATKPNPKS